MEKKIVHPVFFENSYGQERVIAEVQTMEEAFAVIREFCTDRDYNIHYTRYWVNEKEYEGSPCFDLTFDVGSWSEFFHIYFDNMNQVNKFYDTQGQ